MSQTGNHAPGGSRHETTVERLSDRELAVTRLFDAPVARVFEAWTRPALFKRWWAPESMGIPILSCEMDVRTGGGYRIVFGHDDHSAMAFFGRYVDVVENARLVWTNEESPDSSVTTVTLTADGAGTRLVLRELYSTTEALEESITGMQAGMSEQFGQLDTLLATATASS